MRRAAFVAGAAVAVAVGAAPAGAAGAIRVLYEPIDTMTALFSAKELGLFAKAGVEVDLQPMSTGSAMIASAVGGSADIVVPNVLSLAAAIQKGVPLRVIAPNAVYNASSPSTLMLVESGSPIATARDLAGKTIAVNVLNGLAWVATRAWIDKNGGDSKSVKFAEMPFSVMPEALKTHRVDVVVVAEPALSAARPTSRVLAPVYSSIAPLFPIDAFAAPAAWIAANRDTARRFAGAMHDACVWANANHDRSAEITATYLKLETAVIRARTRASFAETPGFDVAQPLLDAGLAYAVLSAPMRARELLAS